MKKYSPIRLLLVLVLSVGLLSKLTAQSTDRKIMHPPPVPNFYITGLCFGDTTRFINKTDFGDIYWGILNDKGDTLYTSVNETFSYFFKKKGSYNISLTANNGHKAVLVRTVLVDTIIKADFSYRPCINEFNNLSTCADHFIWMLPGNVTTTDTFPSYQFKSAGAHSVKLTAIKGNKVNTTVKTITMTPDSLGIPDALFTFRKLNTPDTYELKAVDSLQKSYSWTFGDRQFDETTGYKVVHQFDMSKYDGSVQLRIASSCGFSFYSIDPFKATAIEENFSMENISVYPNPVTDELNISVSGLAVGKKMHINLIDAKGAIVGETEWTVTKSSSSVFNVTSLPKGIYLLQLRVDGQVQHKKVMVH